MPSVRACVLVAGFLATATVAAQQTGEVVPFGGLRVPACPPADDPQYGLVKEKAIPIGGGPMYMAGRQRRYLSLLRGPQGQEVRVLDGVGSSPLNPSDKDALVIIDQYRVVYDGPNGPVTTAIFMDAYHLGVPKVPVGFTCGGPLPSVGMPPVDPFKATPSLVALAIELGSKSDIALARLDPSVPRGQLLDQFAIIALRARAAAASGTPLDPVKPPKDIEPAGLMVVAHPVMCGDRTVAPMSIDLTGTQGPLARRTIGEVLRGEELARAVPGLNAPPGSIGIRFRQGQPTETQITYSEACNGAATVTLPVRAEPARLVQSSMAVMPAGTVEPDPTIYLHAIVDPEGRFAHAEYLGGPRSLLPVALDTVGQWRANPMRMNGVPSVFPVVLQVIFRPN